MPEGSAERHRKARLNNPEKYKKTDKQRYQKRKEAQCLQQKEQRVLRPENYILKQVKSRAKRLGTDFNLEVEDIVIPKFCPILGLELKISSGTHSPESPSLDRVDNSLGYIKGNVRVISFKANRYKSDLSLIQIKSLLDYVEGRI